MILCLIHFSYITLIGFTTYMLGVSHLLIQVKIEFRLKYFNLG